MTFYYKGQKKEVPKVKCWYPQTVVYDPIKAGSIDSTDIEPHDDGVVRAVNSTFKPNYKATGNPLHTIFVGRLSLDTTEKDLEKEFCHYGKMVALRLVRDIVTGLSKRYAFIEYETSKMALNAYIRCKSLIIKNSRLYIDYECGRILPGWKPRRLGGGFGGEKQSGQLRFGGRYRYFKQPLNLVGFINNQPPEEKYKAVSSSSTASYSVSSSTSNRPGRSVVSLPLTPPLNPLVASPLTPPSYPVVALPLTPPLRPMEPLTPPSPQRIALPLTPPSHSSVVLPLTPPSHSNVPLPLTPPSNSNVPLPLTPPLHNNIQSPISSPPPSNVILPLTPPSHSNVPLPLTPPSNSNVPLPLTPPLHSNGPPHNEM